MTDTAVRCCFFVPVAPNDRERAAWAVDSILTYCPESRVYLLPDGVNPADLDFPAVRAPNVRIIVNPAPTKGHWGEILRMQMLAMRQALKEPDVTDDCVLIKMDSDAVIVRHGLVQRALRLLETRPEAGQVGQCFSNIVGGRISNLGWENFFRKSYGLHGLRMFLTSKVPGREVSFRARLGAWREFRALVREARANGYMWGEFAIGGCYMMRAELLRRLDQRGWIDANPFQLLPKVGEDVAMTPFVYAAGFSAMDDCADDGLFAVYGKEPLMHPLDLKKRGHYIIHPFKYGVTRSEPKMNEQALVEALTQ